MQIRLSSCFLFFPVNSSSTFAPIFSFSHNSYLFLCTSVKLHLSYLWLSLTHHYRQTISCNQSTLTKHQNQINRWTQTWYKGEGHTSKDAKHQTKYMHDLIIHETLRKKARQHNITERKSHTTQLAQDSYFSRKKLPRVGLEPTTVCLLGVRSYQLSYRDSSAGWARITYTIQSNQSTSTKTSQTRWTGELKLGMKEKAAVIKPAKMPNTNQVCICMT